MRGKQQRNVLAFFVRKCSDSKIVWLSMSFKNELILIAHSFGLWLMTNRFTLIDRSLIGMVLHSISKLWWGHWQHRDNKEKMSNEQRGLIRDSIRINMSQSFNESLVY